MRTASLLFVLLLSASAMADDEKKDRPVTAHPPGKKIPHRGPTVSGPVTGGKKDITNSNDVHLQEVSHFAEQHLATENPALRFVQVKAEIQVVAGLMYTLQYEGNDGGGVCQEEHTLVVYDKPWVNERVLKSDTKTACS